MKMRSVQILGRTWRDNINGNTYHSARVFVDGVLVGKRECVAWGETT